MFGLVLCLIDLLFVGIVTIVAYPFSLLLGVFSKKAQDNFSLGFIKIFMKSLLFFAGVKVTYKGLQYLTANSDAKVIIGNHRSFFDVIATYAVMPAPTGFVAKKEMKNWPVISLWMKAGHCLFMDRNDSHKGVQTILEAVKKVGAGINMIIYPEGRRSKTEGFIGTFHEGSFFLPIRSKSDIIPVSYSGSGAIWEDHMPWVKPGKMIVEFSPAISTSGLSASEKENLPEQVREIILKNHIKNSKELGTI